MKSNVQRAYDEAAEAYADRLFDELARKPFDRAMLDRIVAVRTPPLAKTGVEQLHS